MKHKTKNKIDWDLIAKHFTGESNYGENEMVENWKNTNIDNKKLYKNVKKDIENIDLYNEKMKFDTKTAFRNLKFRLGEENLLPKINKTRKLTIQIARIAAIIIIVFGYVATHI